MTHSWTALADNAARDVNDRFGHRLMGLPGTWIGALRAPVPTPNAPAARGRRIRGDAPWSEWHYWWQAHYLDAIVDMGCHYVRAGAPEAAKAEVRRGLRLLRGIKIRNFGVFPNYFFDDMAWLALSSHRLNALCLELHQQPAKLAQSAVDSLTRQLRSGQDSVLGGGLYWSRKRAFKNVPVNGPAALHFARIGDRKTAASLVDWMREKLFDPTLGLYLDGIYLVNAGHRLEGQIYTYNQGPILGAWLELGDERYLRQAADLIDAVDRGLTVPQQGLRLEQGGDGGLFTGILCRYLALAATDHRLPQRARQTAARLVSDTAATVLDKQTAQLSEAVQRWSILSAAAVVTQSTDLKRRTS
ncbi:glycoside hydrolase family 76 protein [Glutamicibacter sp. V16R2B1]|uniref:glycoside hydrolase family 76 protein n=1 Tax=Glutamicibacter sp. V16R2B1 TaxID=2036207 RepID=UPI0010FD2BC7|nr:glycoside hydrolase family 76 protein [Glutamicibacter sp. V16R2B1]TLK55295.1 glycosyl hydrolase [Glutamicibacter sp. V16R2B1]